MINPIIILLIDDDEDDIEIFKEVVLKEIDLPIDIITGANGLECLTLLAQIEPDIIFLDINMPLMNGKECLKIIKAKNEYKKIPVVVYSTTTSKQEIESVQKLGALFLSKQFSFKNAIPPLVSIITKLVNK